MQFLWKRRKTTAPSSLNNGTDETVALLQACQRNDLEYIKQHLPQLSIRDINYQHQSQANYTALHEATRQGNSDIVKLLLEHGADRCLKNDNKETPVLLSPTDEIRALFKRPKSDQRFICICEPLPLPIIQIDKKTSKNCSLNNDKSFYEWELVDLTAAQNVINFRRELKPYITDKELKRRIYIINKGYIAMRLDALADASVDKKEIEKICSYFKEALDKNNPCLIVRAYTKNKEFSKMLNCDMARNVMHDLHYACSKLSCICSYTTEDGTKAIASILLHCNQLRDYSEGIVYRGIYMKSDILAHYSVGRCIITTTFLSTSPNKQCAEMFSGYDKDQKKLCGNEKGYASFLCTYIIKNYHKKYRTAISINEFSEFKDEEEVLILPYAAFLITKKTPDQLHPDERIEIELEECSDDQLIEYTRGPTTINSMQ